MNVLCRDLSIITNRHGRISIALDDDKIWLGLSGKNAQDKAGLKYTSHIRDNQKKD